MKNLIVVFSILFSITTLAKPITGYVTIKGQRQEVKLEVPYSKDDKLLIDYIYKGLSVYDVGSTKPIEAKTNYVSKIEFTDKDYGKITLIALTKKGDRNPANHYYRVLEEGNVSLLTSVKVSRSAQMGTTTFISQFIHSKALGLIRVSNSNFKKKVLKNLEKCPALKERLKFSWYELHDMQKVIRFYNKSC